MSESTDFGWVHANPNVPPKHCRHTNNPEHPPGELVEVRGVHVCAHCDQIVHWPGPGHGPVMA